MHVGRWSVALALMAPLAAAAAPLLPAPARAQAGCQFVLGFARLRDLVGPAVVGDCLEDERFNPASGNAEQRTTGGLLVWRQADNWTAFTDGYRTWLAGPDTLATGGLWVRLNTERFDWEGDSEAGAPPAAPPAPTPIPNPHPPAPDPQAQAAVDAALRDAAARVGVPPNQLRLEHLERREWPDSSLGCPQPGFFYLQVITPGYLVMIAGAGQRLEYHTDTRGRAVFCRES
jgi:hypothetical protein